MNLFDFLRALIVQVFTRSAYYDEIPPDIVMKPIITPPNSDVLVPDWSIPKNAYHNTRVLCDLSGLTVEEKNIICACVFQESRFLVNPKPNQNKDAQGKVWSIDYGIVQINDWYHIGVHKDFPSVQYVLENPQKCVQWMIDMYKANRLGMWASYSSNAYRQWLLPASPMWLLK